jgi:hypothetical protein
MPPNPEYVEVESNGRSLLARPMTVEQERLMALGKWHPDADELYVMTDGKLLMRTS